VIKQELILRDWAENRWKNAVQKSRFGSFFSNSGFGFGKMADNPGFIPYCWLVSAVILPFSISVYMVCKVFCDLDCAQITASSKLYFLLFNAIYTYNNASWFCAHFGVLASACYDWLMRDYRRVWGWTFGMVSQYLQQMKLTECMLCERKASFYSQSQQHLACACEHCLLLHNLLTVMYFIFCCKFCGVYYANQSSGRTL
jgi:hypothetical protein